MSPHFVVSIFLFVILISTVVHSQQCGGESGKKFVRFPNDNGLMTMEDFNEHVLNRTLKELYFGMPQPPPFEPDRSYVSTFTQVEGANEYLIISGGVTQGENPSCSSYETSLRLGPAKGRALFKYKDNPVVQAYMSSCPASYIISLRCIIYDYTLKRCPIDSTYISVYLRTSIDDVPISDIAQELCKTTRVKFGSQDLKWFFTYGEDC